MTGNLLLEVVTPAGVVYSGECDSVTINIQENKKGNAEGSYGIRKGHANAVFALKEGITTAKKDGNICFSAKTSEGFAVIADNKISVAVDEVNGAL